MPSNDRIIVGIDVGTHKVCTVVAETTAGGGAPVTVLGVGAVASEGVAKGMITDIVKASSAIGHSLEAAERQSGCRILSAYVSITGNHISSTNSRGLVAVSNPERIIGQDDIARAVEAARAMAIPAGRDVVHVIPRSYTVDGQEGIRNPLGLSGFRLDVETHVVTGATNVRENLIRCVQKADVEVDDLVLSSLASAEAVLTEQEKNLGAAVVDIGHGTTDVAIYVEGSVWHTKVLPLGGWHLTNDLVLVFNIPYDAAEALKLQYGEATLPDYYRQAAQTANGKAGQQEIYARAQAGSGSKAAPASGNGHLNSANASSNSNGNGNSNSNGSGNESAGDSSPDLETMLSEAMPEGEMLETTDFEGNACSISRNELNAVMAARLDQLFGLVHEEIKRSGYEGLLPAGVVLTGGVASMPGIERVAQRKLRMPVRLGRPRRIGGLADAFESPMYATSVGLVLWGLKQGTQPAAVLASGPFGRGPRSNEDRQGLLAKWLRKFLPRET